MSVFDELINELCGLDEIDGILLGGSRATGMNDEKSDYDIYVYLNSELFEQKRKNILNKYCSYMEYSNKFWELEDDGILNDGIDIEFIYRKIEDIDEMLHSIVFEHNSWMGYTTCFWDNILNSKILFDRNGRLKELKNKYDIPYPKELKSNIIKKNFMLLKDKSPSFYYQIKKAIERNDLISINHRTTEFLSCYYDIIFAINEKLHPGEKRLLEQTEALKNLPVNYKENIISLLNNMYKDNNLVLEILDEMISNLYALLIENGYKLSYESYIKNKVI